MKHSEENTTENREDAKEKSIERAEARLLELFREIFEHDGYGHLDVSIRFMKRGQKEILLRCGKEYRFVVDFPAGQGE